MRRRDAFRDASIIDLRPFQIARAALKAGALSGGEQQMLSFAHTLAGDPSLVVIDEPGEGLAPQVLAQVAVCLATLRERGVAMLLIEERLTIAHMLDARVAVMGHGAIRFDGSLAALDGSEAVKREWLSVR